MSKNYPPYEVLCEEYQEQRISAVDFVTQQSDEITDEYTRYCKDEGLDPQSDASALTFMEYRDSQFDESMEN